MKEPNQSDDTQKKKKKKRKTKKLRAPGDAPPAEESVVPTALESVTIIQPELAEVEKKSKESKLKNAEQSTTVDGMTVSIFISLLFCES